MCGASRRPGTKKLQRRVKNEPNFQTGSENSRRLWLFPGSVRGFARKTSGKSQENCWKNCPELPNATNSRISGTGKGKPAGNLGSTLPGPCPPPSVFFYRQFQPSRVLLKKGRNHRKIPAITQFCTFSAIFPFFSGRVGVFFRQFCGIFGFGGFLEPVTA